MKPAGSRTGHQQSFNTAQASKSDDRWERPCPYLRNRDDVFSTPAQGMQPSLSRHVRLSGFWTRRKYVYALGQLIRKIG